VRIVVAALGEGALNDDMTLLVDTREEQVSNLAMYLACIPGIAPLGRVRA